MKRSGLSCPLFLSHFRPSVPQKRPINPRLATASFLSCLRPWLHLFSQPAVRLSLELGMAENLPYLVSPGTLATAFQKIKAAATPERFTQDFLANTLGMKGGTPRPIIPFLKRIGFLAGDGAPTERYKSFRNPAQSGLAVS